MIFAAKTMALAGLERLYEEAQVWEQSAGRTYSLNPELATIHLQTAVNW